MNALCIYCALCLYPLSLCNVYCPCICVLAAVLRSSFSLLIPYCPLLHDHVHLLAVTSAGPFVIIILYTGTGSVFRLGRCAGAKRGACQWPGIGGKRKHATASSHIFLILSAHHLIKTTHDGRHQVT